MFYKVDWCTIERTHALIRLNRYNLRSKLYGKLPYRSENILPEIQLKTVPSEVFFTVVGFICTCQGMMVYGTATHHISTMQNGNFDFDTEKCVIGLLI